MFAINYQQLFVSELSLIADSRPGLLLHSCCAVCSSHVISLLASHFSLSVFFYNPNIFPRSEYEKRKSEQKRLLLEVYGGAIDLIDADYEHDLYLDTVEGLEKCGEGGERCELCFLLRLRKTAESARKLGFEYFCSTLSVSPHKSSAAINEAGMRASGESGIKWLPSDFKKRDGYLHSVRLAEQYGLYRQKYCGCEFAMSHLSETKQ
ncbi:MAG: epoxyqueuosine reductase QueH [Oscillospiraceae bacterium]